MIMLILVALAGMFKGFADTLLHHFSTSIFKDKNPYKWNPYESWRAKYKNGDPLQGEAFPLSTTLLVALTDWWHRFDLARIMLMCLAIGVATQLEWNLWLTSLCSIGVFLLSFNITYYLSYKKSKNEEKL